MIATNWKDFGFLMDLDPEGKHVATIEAENAHKRMHTREMVYLSAVRKFLWFCYKNQTLYLEQFNRIAV